MYEKGGEYGYEQQLSQNQIDAGQASASLVIVRYLGNKRRGVYQAEILNGYFTVVLSCPSPCHFITMREYYRDLYGTPFQRNMSTQLIRKEVVPATNGMLATLIMQDAMNGQLRIYGTRVRSQAGRN